MIDLPRLTIHIDRSMLLTANQRLHWRAKAERTASLRALTTAIAGRGWKPATELVRCVVHIGYPDNRRRDVHNLMPTVKACIDGLVDAGFLTDDSDKYLQGPDLRPIDERCARGMACSLTFDFEPAL